VVTDIHLDQSSLHVDKCIYKCNMEIFLQKVWVENFIHTFFLFPSAWYLHKEVGRQNNKRKSLMDGFFLKFSYTSKTFNINFSINPINSFLFDSILDIWSYHVCRSHHYNKLYKNPTREWPNEISTFRCFAPIQNPMLRINPM
jgi:hypothetical protein